MHPTSAQRPDRPRGFTLVEVLIASAILMYTIAGILTGINLGCILAKRSHHETVCELRCIDRLEEVITTPYLQITNSLYPTEYQSISGNVNALEWTMTTTVQEVWLTPAGEPIRYKRIDVYAGWNTYGGKNKYTTFVLLKSPISLKTEY